MNRNTALFGLIMGLAYSFLVYNALHWLNDWLFTTVFPGKQGLSDKFIAIISVVSNVFPIGILNKQFRYETAKGMMMTTMILVFVVLYFFRAELLGS